MTSPTYSDATGFSSDEFELLMHMLEEEGLNESQDHSIPCYPRNPSDAEELTLPASFAQERLWFLDQLMPGSATYNVPSALHLTGPLNVAALEQSLASVVQRHETLRTTLIAVDGQPMQRIARTRTVTLPLIDLTDLPAAERERRVQQLAQEDGERPFDLATGPLLRTMLLRLAADEHVLLLTMHHIISDGWSMGVLVQEVASLYAAAVTGQPGMLDPAGTPLPIQYADYAIWQRDYLAPGAPGDTLAQQLAYWKQQLASAPAILELPTDYPRPAVLSYHGANYNFSLSPELTAALNQLSRREGTTLFMTLLAAWQVLLMRYSGQEDLVVGSSVAGRTRAETEGLIGFFVNTLALRGDLSGQPSFRQLLSRVRETTLDAYAHQDLPFEQLVEALQPVRSANHTPIFQVTFELQNVPETALQLPGLTIKPMDIDRGAALFELMLMMTETPNGLTGLVEYTTDLFAEATIVRMVAHFTTLLEHLVANPDQSITAIPLLTAAEQQQMLHTWNATDLDFPREQCFHELFEAQVARAPSRIAAVCGAEQLTYAQLNQRANYMAHTLVAQGIGPGQIVAILAERGTDFLSAVLGIFKAGGAYLPLDPAHPPARLATILRQSRARLVLVAERFAPQITDALTQLAPQQPPTVLTIETLRHHEQPRANLPRRATPQDLAYVIFTSGSTGLPKGAMVEQLGMVNHIYAKIQDLQLTAEDRIVQNASQCFDISVWQFLTALLIGAQVHIVSNDIARDPALLLQEVEAHHISILEIVPSLLRATLDELAHAGDHGPTLTALRWLILTGEALPPDLARKWLRAYPQIPLLNAYGPTECSDDVTHYPITVPPAEEVIHLPIGRPVANTQLYILDQWLMPVPVGVPGQIAVGGIGVGRGYLYDVQRTAQVFISNPFSAGPGGQPGARLYLTGDLGRYLPDGSIEYLRRIDHQVKVRGFRIELGEIEVALSEHPDVAQAIVLVREDTPGDKRLVAYVAARRAELAPSDLQAYLRSRLPEYMVPSAVLLLDALPLTANGKLDRKALPAPEWTAVEARRYVAPQTPTEELLAGIWAEVLGVAQVGITDNFFALGGHSLLATRVMARIREAFQVHLPLRAIFDTPTIAQLADTLTHALQGALDQPAPPLIQREHAGPLPLSFAQERLWMIDQLTPGNSAYNIPVALRLRGTLDRAALHDSLNTIIQRHAALRTTFAVQRARPVQVITPNVRLELPLINLANLPTAEREVQVQQLAQAEAERSFDLAAGPLLRATLIHLAAEEHVLLLTMHHIVSDGWSMGVLVQEVTTLYAAAVTGQPVALPELPIQYADYALWQRDYLQGDTLAQQLAYWTRQLANAPAILELPTDRPRPAVQSFRGARCERLLTPAHVAEIQQVSQREGVTLFMTLLAAWQVLLMRYSGQEDIVVGSPVAGRTQVETEGLIGCFLNTLALRTDLSGNPSFHELLGRVRATTLGAYAHQDVPFEKVIEQVAPSRDRRHPPIFQVMFNLLNFEARRIDLPNLEVEPLWSADAGAKFDLTLHVAEEADGLHLRLAYNADLFEATTIERLLDHFIAITETIVSAPETPIAVLIPRDTVQEAALIDAFNEALDDF